MKSISFVVFALILFPAIIFAQNKDANKEGPRIYMPYSKAKDHMVVGIELPGYHMRYDIAQSSNIFMVLLPDGFDDMVKTPVYFSIDTLALYEFSVKETFENDIEALTKNINSLRVVNKFDGKNLQNAGECYGAEVAYPGKDRLFPNEIFYICKNKSNKYAILLSIGAKDRKSLENHLPNFIKWANAPQVVTDYKVIELPEKN
jgi:hypothetical protein